MPQAVAYLVSAMQERMRKMTPEARAKFTERKKKLEQQRMMSKFVKKK